jgi:ATP-dependent Clp protease adapter protein ClpS
MGILQSVRQLVDRTLRIVRPQQSVVLPQGTALTELPEFVPPGFSAGVEILNDNRTPMEFVINMLNKHVGLGYDDSVHTMANIHNRGGALVPTASLADAQTIARNVADEAARAKHPLVCRAVTKDAG